MRECERYDIRMSLVTLSHKCLRRHTESTWRGVSSLWVRDKRPVMTFMRECDKRHTESMWRGLSSERHSYETVSRQRDTRMSLSSERHFWDTRMSLSSERHSYETLVWVSRQRDTRMRHSYESLVRETESLVRETESLVRESLVRETSVSSHTSVSLTRDSYECLSDERLTLGLRVSLWRETHTRSTSESHTRSTRDTRRPSVSLLSERHSYESLVRETLVWDETLASYECLLSHTSVYHVSHTSVFVTRGVRDKCVWDERHTESMWRGLSVCLLSHSLINVITGLLSRTPLVTLRMSLVTLSHKCHYRSLVTNS